MKSFYFLSGLPRSGNTVLSSIINQNNNIYSSPISPVLGYIWTLYNHNQIDENVIRLEDKTGCYNVLSNILPIFYSNIEKSIIIDREKNWGTPANLDILKKIFSNKIKIIFTTRGILNILNSYMKLSQNSQYLDLEMKKQGWWNNPFLSINDNRCDFLMRPQGTIDTILTTLWEIKKSENANIFHIVEYDSLINNPEETMYSIYNFLEIPQYVHNFNNIIKIENDNDIVLGYPENMHHVRPKLEKNPDTNNNLLSDYVINKYGKIQTK